MKNKLKGFTLIELLGVIIILAIIALIAVPKVLDAINESKEATCRYDSKVITDTAELYVYKNGISVGIN